MFEAFELHRVEGNEAVLRPKPGNQGLVQFARDALGQKNIAQQLGEIAGKPMMRITVENIEQPIDESKQPKKPALPPVTEHATSSTEEHQERPPNLQDAIKEASRSSRPTQNTDEPMNFDEAMDLPWVKQFLEVFPDARIHSVTKRTSEKPKETETLQDDITDEKESD